jgi:hypothetical protein
LQAVVSKWGEILARWSPDPLRVRGEWLSNIRGDLLAGIVVALALMPEAIAFSIIAGVDPQGGPVRVVLHRRGHRVRGWPAGHDLGSAHDRCRRRHDAGRQTAVPLAVTRRRLA